MRTPWRAASPDCGPLPVDHAGRARRGVRLRLLIGFADPEASADLGHRELRTARRRRARPPRPRGPPGREHPGQGGCRVVVDHDRGHAGQRQLLHDPQAHPRAARTRLRARASPPEVLPRGQACPALVAASNSWGAGAQMVQATPVRRYRCWSLPSILAASATRPAASSGVAAYPANARCGSPAPPAGRRARGVARRPEPVNLSPRSSKTAASQAGECGSLSAAAPGERARERHQQLHQRRPGKAPESVFSASPCTSLTARAR